MIDFQISGSAHSLYPADMIFGLLWQDEKSSLEIPKMISYAGEWGEILSNQIRLDSFIRVPKKLSLLWISLVEAQMYYVETDLPTAEMEKLLGNQEERYTHIVVGMGLYGKYAVWVAGQNKSTLVCSDNGEMVEDGIFKDINPYNLNIELKPYCQMMLEGLHKALNNLQNEGLPKQNIFTRYMNQYTFRYVLRFDRLENDRWVELKNKDTHPTLESLRDVCMDGTYNLTHNVSLCQIHKTGIPKRVMLSLSKDKNKYDYYFDLLEECTIILFEKFYGAHPETKADFIIRIDVENKKYELALYRQGLKEPVVIPESAYQLIVFKNKFEDYRSENYNQPRGAWIW